MMVREYRWDSGNIVIAPHGGMEEGGYVPGDISRLMPGTGVTHRLNGGSGMIIECGEKTCKVLWSEPPSIDFEIESQEIKAKSRKLRAKWSAQSMEDINAFGEITGPGFSVKGFEVG